MAIEPTKGRIPTREFDEELDELTSVVEENVRRFSSSRAPGRATRNLDSALNLIREDLRRALEAELLPIGEAQPGDEIELTEREREISKRALVNLKIAQLRQLAAEHKLGDEGSREELAERIARAYSYDEEQLARLILSRDKELTPQRGITDRIYPIQPVPDLLTVMPPVVEDMVGHYIRVGIAQWFIFDSASVSGPVIEVSGAFRAYRADAQVRKSRYQFRTREIAAPVEIRIDTEQGLAYIRARAIEETNGALKALEALTPFRRLGALPLVPTYEGPLMSWDPRTLLLLDLLDVKFRTGGLDVANVTLVQFEMDRPNASDGVARPIVRSVRLEGEWVGSSPQVCQFLVARRPLVGTSFTVRYRAAADEDFLFPSQIALHSDHVDVLTGFAGEPHEVARIAHDRLVSQTARALSSQRPSDHLEELAHRIMVRAEELGPVNEADILGPAQDRSTEVFVDYGGELAGADS